LIKTNPRLSWDS